MSVGLVIQDFGSLDFVDARVKRLSFLDMRELLDVIGAEGESQTRRRIQEEKRGPDNEYWDPWSEKYEKTRSSAHSLLVGTQELLDSIQYEIETDAVSWGSNLIYARTHQQGDDDREIPARPFLGLSDENEDAVNKLVVKFIEDLL